jgi:signal transduction histidine kinase
VSGQEPSTPRQRGTRSEATSLSSAVDDTARARPEEIRELLESERRHRLIAEELHRAAQDITAKASLDDVLAAVVHSAEKLFGVTSVSIVLIEKSGNLRYRCFTTRQTGEPHWDEQGLDDAPALIRSVVQTGQSVIAQTPAVDPLTPHSGESAPGTCALIPMRRGDIVSDVLIVDWNDRRTCGPSDLQLLETLAAYGAVAIENARLRSRDRAARLETEEARLRLQQFVGMVAHDLRGPLGVIATSLELLRDSPRGHRAGLEQYVLPATENAIRRMRRLVDDLLGAARIGAGRFQVRPFPMDLVDVANRVVDQIQTTTQIHRLELDAPDRLDGEWDPERIGQLLTNLISNAIKYSPDGGEVRIHITRSDQEVVIQVSDQGIGISPEQAPLLFEPFVRLGHEPETDGLGLGLYIAKGIVEAHGGRIWVESEVNLGTSFFVALPVVNDSSLSAFSDDQLRSEASSSSAG